MRVAAKVPSDQQLCFEHKQVSLSVRGETCWRVTARNSLRKKRRYLHCCQPDESCQRQSLGLQPASQHILRCPARYHRCTSTGGRWNMRTPLQILILILVYPPERQEEKK